MIDIGDFDGNFGLQIAINPVSVGIEKWKVL